MIELLEWVFAICLLIAPLISILGVFWALALGGRYRNHYGSGSPVAEWEAKWCMLMTIGGAVVGASAWIVFVLLAIITNYRG